MIYITGDIHGDRSRFQAAKKAGIKKGDTLLVCGDFGFLWEGGKKEERILSWIGRLPYQVFFVDGAHENHRLLENYPIEEALDGRVRRISGRLCALLRGEVYSLEGKRVFAFGGGDSRERYSRREGEERWMPSEEEMENARRNLARVDQQVDLVITHDAPAMLRQFIEIDSHDELTSLQTFLEEISRTVRYRRWYVGKYHLNKVIPPRFQLLFTAVAQYGRTE